MGDEDLRALERAVHTGEAGARLRLAAEYERRGRRDDAIGALLPGADDLEVRRALGALPCWGGGASGWRHLDVPAPPTAPETAWVRSFAPGAGMDLGLLASPLGVVVRASEVRARCILDARTGEPRCRYEGSTPEAIVGGVLLSTGLRKRCWAKDLHGGAALHVTTFRTTRFWILGGLFIERVQRTVRGARAEMLEARRLVDPRQPPALAWRREEALLRPRFAGRRLAWLWAGDPQNVIVDVETGAERIALAGRIVAFDDGGVLQDRDDRWTLFDGDGRRLWSAPGPLAVVAMGPDAFVAVTPRDGPSDGVRDVPVLAAFDRATGQERWRKGPWAGMRTAATRLVRDALYVLAGDALSALDLATGEVRWRVDLAALSLAGTHGVAPLGRRFYGVAPGGRVFCLRAS